MSPLGISAARTASLPAVLALLLLAVAAPFAIRGRGAAPPAPREAPAHPNVLLFSIDTLRADHLGCYGYARDTSPNLDALADRSLRFTEAFAPAPYTLPSHVAMLTGIHPHALGIENRRSAIPAETRLLAELLSEAGYRSAAFVDSMPRGFVGGSRGFARGFDEYTHMPERAKRGYRYDMAATADAAARWLAGRADDRPFFLFLHTKSVHTLPSRAGGKNPMHFPYDKPEPYRSRFLSDAAAGLSWSEPKLGSGVDYLRALNERLASGEISPADIPRERVDALVQLYDGGIYYVDHHFGRVLEALKATGEANRTVILVTADHGEAFLDHNLFLHKELYRPVLRVPLLVHRPWAPQPRASGERVSLMDLAPTILDLAGVPRPAQLAAGGLPLGDAAATPGGDPDPEFAYYRSRRNYYYEAWALRDGPWTLIHHRMGRGQPFSTEIYDARVDPSERSPVRDQPEREREMLARLESWRERAPQSNAPDIELDAETVEHLRALGYAN